MLFFSDEFRLQKQAIDGYWSSFTTATLQPVMVNHLIVRHYYVSFGQSPENSYQATTHHIKPYAMISSHGCYATLIPNLFSSILRPCEGRVTAHRARFTHCHPRRRRLTMRRLMRMEHSMVPEDGVVPWVDASMVMLREPWCTCR